MGKTALVACAVIGCATPSALLNEQRVLTEIEFEGNASIPDSELREQIATRETNGLITKDVRYYDPELFLLDQKRLVRWYQMKGFYLAKITDLEEQLDAEGRVKLVVHFDEGVRAKVKTLEIEGLAELTDEERKRVREALPLREGEPFDEIRFERSKLVLKEQLGELGFGRAEASGKARVEVESGSVALAYQAVPGSRLRFGPVTVSGNENVKSGKISDAAGIEPGTLYRPSVLRNAERRVYQLGAFSGVRALIDPAAQGAETPVDLRVREAPRHTIRFGIGAELDYTRWEIPHLRVEYADRNLAHRLLRLELSAGVGLAFVPNVASALAGGPGTKLGVTTEDSAVFKVPRAFLGADLGLSAEFEREIQSGYGYDQVAGRISLGWRFGNHTIIPSLNFENYFHAAIDLDLQSLIDQGNEAVANLASSNCLPGCTLFYPGLRWSWDNRDSAIEPRRGFLVSIDLRQTAAGSFHYFRLEPDLRVYVPLSKTLLFFARAQYGALILEGSDRDTEASPFPQRFFGGGQTYMRGYTALQQGPKIGGAIEDGHFTSWISTGGNGSMLLSAELRLRTDSWLEHTGMVFFVDASRITLSGEAPWSGSPLEIAPGAGLRYLTSFGAIRLDVAYLVNPTIQTLPSVTTKAPDGSEVTVPPTIVAPACSAYPGTPCLFQRPWVFHLGFGESF